MIDSDEGRRSWLGIVRTVKFWFQVHFGLVKLPQLRLDTLHECDVIVLETRVFVPCCSDCNKVQIGPWEPVGENQLLAQLSLFTIGHNQLFGYILNKKLNYTKKEKFMTSF